MRCTTEHSKAQCTMCLYCLVGAIVARPYIGQSAEYTLHTKLLCNTSQFCSRHCGTAADSTHATVSTTDETWRPAHLWRSPVETLHITCFSILGTCGELTYMARTLCRLLYSSTVTVLGVLGTLSCSLHSLGCYENFKIFRLVILLLNDALYHVPSSIQHHVSLYHPVFIYFWFLMRSSYFTDLSFQRVSSKNYYSY